MNRAFTPHDEGKRVVTADGHPVATIVDADADRAYVRPLPHVLRACGSWLNCSWKETDRYPLDDALVCRVDDSTVVLSLESSDLDPADALSTER